MLHAKLKVVGGRHHGRLIALATKKFLIGREQDCHLRPNSELVSRHHCVFAVDDFSVRIRDLGSTNGTFVNDDRVRGEVVLSSGDRIRVGKLDFELVVGDPVPTAGDSNHGSQTPVDPLAAETAPLAGNDTSFEIPVSEAPEDSGSSIIGTESMTPVPAAAPTGDSTVIWTQPAVPGYGQEMYPQMGMPYPQAPYQPYPYMTPSMGYQPHMPYPQMPMGYPGMYPQQMGMYPQAPAYMPQQQPAAPSPAPAEPEDNEAISMPTVRLPDPKTTGAKAPPPPPKVEPPPPAPTNGEENGGMEQKKPEPPPAKPSQSAADILKNYTQRRPV